MSLRIFAAVFALAILALAAGRDTKRAARYEQTEFMQRNAEFATAYNRWCQFRNDIEAGQVLDVNHAKEARLWQEMTKAFRRLESSPGLPEQSAPSR